jgi:hypothetical protein
MYFILTKAHATYMLWCITIGQVKDFHKHIYSLKADGTKKKGTTGARINWMTSCTFYSNLASFAKLISVAGVYPRLSNDAKLAVPSLINFQKALEGDRMAVNECKAMLRTITNSMLTVDREFGTYLRKIHKQDYLQEKTLLLPMLVMIFVRFEVNVEMRNTVWPQGYLCKVATNSKLEAPRMMACLKHRMNDKEEEKRPPAGYLSLRPGDIKHRQPLCFEFLPFIAFVCKFEILGQHDLMVNKAQGWLNQVVKMPLVVVTMEAAASPSPSPTKKKRARKKSTETSDTNDTTVTTRSSKRKKGTVQYKEKNEQDESLDIDEKDDMKDQSQDADDDEDMAEVVVSPITEEEEKLINKIDVVKVPLTEADWIQPGEPFEWNGAADASKTEIFDALNEFVTKQEIFLELVQLQNELATHLPSARYQDLMEQKDESDDVPKLLNKYLQICMSNYGQVNGTKESITECYNNAITKYELQAEEKKAKEMEDNTAADSAAQAGVMVSSSVQGQGAPKEATEVMTSSSTDPIGTIEGKPFFLNSLISYFSGLTVVCSSNSRDSCNIRTNKQ